MNPNPDTQNQPSKTISERLPPPVLAAIVTGVFALITALAGGYFPNRVRLDELRIGATQTAESRAILATQAAGGGELPTTQPPTATPVLSPTDTATPTATSTPSPQATDTARPTPGKKKHN